MEVYSQHIKFAYGHVSHGEVWASNSTFSSSFMTASSQSTTSAIYIGCSLNTYILLSLYLNHQFKKLPLSSSVHCFIRPSFSESDSLYSQLLKKIGFGESRGRLIYVADDSGVDRITLAITAIHAVTKLEWSRVRINGVYNIPLIPLCFLCM